MLNTLLGIRQLVLMGLDYQARVLARVFIEVSDMLMAITAYEDCYADYLKFANMTGQDASKFWNQKLSPKNIRNRVSKILDTYNIPEDMRRTLSQQRRTTYENLSNVSHGGWSALAFGGYAIDSSRRRLEFNLGGQFDELSGRTLLTVSTATFLCSLTLIELLAAKHHFQLNPVKPETSRFLIQQEVYKHLFISSYENALTSIQNTINSIAL